VCVYVCVCREGLFVSLGAMIAGNIYIDMLHICKYFTCVCVCVCVRACERVRVRVIVCVYICVCVARVSRCSRVTYI